MPCVCEVHDVQYFGSQWMIPKLTQERGPMARGTGLDCAWGICGGAHEMNESAIVLPRQKKVRSELNGMMQERGTEPEPTTSVIIALQSCIDRLSLSNLEIALRLCLRGVASLVSIGNASQRFACLRRLHLAWEIFF